MNGKRRKRMFEFSILSKEFNKNIHEYTEFMKISKPKNDYSGKKEIFHHSSEENYNINYLRWQNLKFEGKEATEVHTMVGFEQKLGWNYVFLETQI